MSRLLCVIAAIVVCASPGAAQPWPNRWVYVSRGLGSDRDVDDIAGIVQTAAAHGLNGMVLTGGFDTVDLKDEAYFERLDRVKAVCQQQGIEIIPIIFSVGYGGGVLAHDPHLAAGLPVRDALFVVRGEEATLQPDPPVAIINGGFEEHAGHRFAGFGFVDRPGQVSFADTQVFKEGASALRFSNFENADEHGHARLMQEVAVSPFRHYRVSAWVKTDGLDGADRLSIAVYTEAGQHASGRPGIPPTSDWRQVAMTFNSKQHTNVRVYVGCWGARGGRFWVDDLRIEEMGLVNVLRRPGTPVTVRGEDGTAYDEGRDFARVEDSRFSPYRFDHAAPPLRLMPNSRIRDGQKLRVSFYHPVVINRSQVSVCMSEPAIYEIWRKVAGELERHLAPRKYLLSMDEIRAGGSCAACKARNTTMGEILGECITKQYEMLRAASPGAEVYCWSDMLDPGHNAHGDYYQVEGDFTGSWEHVPKDLRVVCWWYDQRERSLSFFSDLGFKTLAGAYYDGDDLANPGGWLQAMRGTQGCTGIMYTTWQNKYDLLAGFGDLVSQTPR